MMLFALTEWAQGGAEGRRGARGAVEQRHSIISTVTAPDGVLHGVSAVSLRGIKTSLPILLRDHNLTTHF